MIGEAASKMISLLFAVLQLCRRAMCTVITYLIRIHIHIVFEFVKHDVDFDVNAILDSVLSNQ